MAEGSHGKKPMVKINVRNSLKAVVKQSVAWHLRLDKNGENNALDNEIGKKVPIKLIARLDRLVLFLDNLSSQENRKLHTAYVDHKGIVCNERVSLTSDK